MSWDEIGLNGGVKGAVLAESHTENFLLGFRSKQLLLSWTSLPHCWDYHYGSKANEEDP